MQCFSLIAERRIIVAPTYHYPMNFVAPELYPKSKPGIRVSKQRPVIILDDDVRVSISPALLQSKNAEHVVNEGDTFLILRASVQRDENGEITLIAPRSNEYGAIAYLDPGRGTHSSLRFDYQAPEILARGRKHSDVMFGVEETAVVLFPGFRAVSAYRSSRRWVCFGISVVQETLNIRFNGHDVVYEQPV